MRIIRNAVPIGPWGERPRAWRRSCRPTYEGTLASGAVPVAFATATRLAVLVSGGLELWSRPD